MADGPLTAGLLAGLDIRRQREAQDIQRQQVAQQQQQIELQNQKAVQAQRQQEFENTNTLLDLALKTGNLDTAQTQLNKLDGSFVEAGILPAGQPFDVQGILEKPREFQKRRDDLVEFSKIVGDDPERQQALVGEIKRIKADFSGIPVLEKGVEAVEELAPEETTINDPALIRSFEIATSQILEDEGIERGTEAYVEKLTEFREKTQGGLKIVGRDPITGEIFTMGRFTPGLTRTNPQGEIVSVTKARTPAADLKDLSVIDSLIEQIDVIGEIASANPDKIGPLEGRWNTMRIKFAEDKDGTLLKRNITSLIRLAYALSGKQISVQELKMLSEFILPSVNLPDANFQTALGFAGAMLKRDRRTRETRLRDNDYFLGDGRTETPPTGITKDEAREFLNQADGDVEKARELARQAGKEF